MRRLSLRRLSVAALLVAGASSSPTSPITPEQAAFVESTRVIAAEASRRAEAKLLAAFRRPAFRLGLLADGATHLATMSAEDLLDRVKKAMASLEYTSNFGVSPAYRKTHPGDSAMNLETIEKFGYIPNMWELNASASPLVNDTPANQWGILDAAETGLYKLPEFDIKIGLNKTQAQWRPQYLGGNTRRTDIGIARYGAYSAIVRNDVVRQRALTAGADSGGWENGCNSSVVPIQKYYPIAAKLLTRCGGMEFEGKYVPGTADHMLHSFLSNTEIFGETGGHLSRHVYQLLTPHANVRPLETLMYPEGALLGPLRPVDMKLVVADFASLFGTADAEALRAFCKRHSLPLAWALGFGLSWDLEEKYDKLDFLPFSATGVLQSVDRILDPMSWQMTNAGEMAVQTKSWETVTDDAKLCRQLPTSACESRKTWEAWFGQLASANPSSMVIPLYGSECSPDLCFGTVTRGGAQQCLCRKAPSQPEHGAIMV